MTQIRQSRPRRAAEPRSFASWSERAASHAASFAPAPAAPPATATRREESPAGPLSA